MHVASLDSHQLGQSEDDMSTKSTAAHVWALVAKRDLFPSFGVRLVADSFTSSALVIL